MAQFTQRIEIFSFTGEVSPEAPSGRLLSNQSARTYNLFTGYADAMLFTTLWIIRDFPQSCKQQSWF